MGISNSLGNAFSLKCTVEARGTRETFTISWIYSAPRTTVSENCTSSSVSLWFNSLMASHAGIYECNASLTPTTGSESTSITLQCKFIISVLLLVIIAIIFSAHESDCLCEHK